MMQPALDKMLDDCHDDHQVRYALPILRKGF